MNQYLLLGIPENCYPDFSGQGCGPGLLLWRYNVMPFHALLFYLEVKMVDLAFIAGHDVQKEVIALSSISLKQLQ
jgi:hypothetical protein